MVARRFDVFLVNLDSTVRAEIKRTRPCLVISPDEMNRHIRTVIVAPMTTRGRPYPTRVPCRFRRKQGQVVLDQIRTVDVERLARKLGRLDTATQQEVLAVLANWPSERVEHWVALLKARAIENQAVVVGVNRSGEDPNCAYPGRSMVIGPKGDVLAEAGDGPCVLQASADLDALRAYRRDFPALADMRPDPPPPGGTD